MTRAIRLALAFGALVTGLIAAFRWWQSSRVEVRATRDRAESEDHVAQLAIIRAFAKSADLNKRAARWTALAVILDGLSGVVDAME